MEIVVVTGLSGAGKSKTLGFLGDLGYFTIDNFPPMFILSFIEVVEKQYKDIDKLAFGCDVRSGVFFTELQEILSKLYFMQYKVTTIFLEANTNILIKRFKENKTIHPLSKDSDLTNAIAQEREKLENIRKLAEVIIDTSKTTNWELKNIINVKLNGTRHQTLKLEILSFGFKSGIPIESDLVFDMRLIPNPFYIEEMRNSTGLNKNVSDYVYSFDITKTYTNMIIEMLKSTLSFYQNEGKTNLVVAIGCTGGQHRSVAVSQSVFNEVKKYWANINIYHRELEGINE